MPKPALPKQRCERAVIQRYFYETDGQLIKYSDDDATGSPYWAREAPNVKLKRFARNFRRPQNTQIFVDAQQSVGAVEYLDNTLGESDRVIEIGQRILDEVADQQSAAGRSGGGRSFMLGVVEMLDGEVRAATSGESQAGDVLTAINALNEVHRRISAISAKQRQDAPLSDAEQSALDAEQEQQRDPGAVIGTTQAGLKEAYADFLPRKRDKDWVDPHREHHEAVKASGGKRISELGNEIVLLGHVNCAAPQLLANQLSVRAAGGLAKLDVTSMTEIFWDPGGVGVFVDGVRYHHRQRVPSCEKCVNNLRIVVAKALRDTLAREIREDQPQLEQGPVGRRKQLLLLSMEPRILEATRPLFDLLDEAQHLLGVPSTVDLVPQVHLLRRAALLELESATVAAHDERTDQEFRGILAALPENMRQAILGRLPTLLGNLNAERKARRGQHSIAAAVNKLVQLPSRPVARID